MKLEPVTLETPRLVLRPLREADAEPIAALANDWDVVQYMLVLPYPYEPNHATDWIATHSEGLQAGREIHWGIMKRDDMRDSGELIGVIGVHLQLLHRRGGFGYWLGKRHWGNGYATEAAGAVVRYGFETLGLNRLWAEHYPQNAASGRVLEKVGLSREGVMRQHYFKWDSYHDTIVYGIVREDYERMMHDKAQA